MVTLGVDLRATSKRASMAVAIDSQGHVSFKEKFCDDDELLQIVQARKPEVIAVGAPLGLPAGLDCLESTCPCSFKFPQRKGRQLEIELSRMGISCFFTNKGSIISDLIYRSMGLGCKLRELGHNVIETYPHATKVILFGDKVPPKNSNASLVYLRERLSSLVHGLDDHFGVLDRNSCSALLNVYTALLHTQGATDVLGDPEEGLLVLPKLPL